MTRRCVVCVCPRQILHPNLNNFFLADVAWTFSLYIEAVAVLPQLHMFQRKGGEIEAFTSHWVFSIGAARLLDFVRIRGAGFDRPVGKAAGGSPLAGVVQCAVSLIDCVVDGLLTRCSGCPRTMS